MTRRYRVQGSLKLRTLGTTGSTTTTASVTGTAPVATTYSPTPSTQASGTVVSYWAANTGRGGSINDSGAQFVSGVAAGAHVAADGKVFTTGNWDENGGEFKYYPGDGTTGLSFQDVHPGMGHACTYDPTTGKAWAASNEHNGFKGIRRFPLSRSGSEAQVATAGYAYGLAIIGSTIYAACSDNVMRTYNTGTLAAGTTWSIPTPSRNGLAAVAGKLALLSGSTITLYSTSGTQVGFKSGLIDPKGLGVDNRVTPERLVVCQGRTDHRLAVYDTADLTSVVDYFGVQGGVYSSVGEPRGGMVDRSRLVLPRAARIFSDGSWTVVCAALDVRVDYDALQGGTIIRKLPSKTATTATWELYGLAFCDAGFIDPNTGVDLFTPNFWHKFDQASGAWSPFAMTLDIDTYSSAYAGGTTPQSGGWDVRDQPNHDNTTPWLFTVGGARFMVLQGMYGTSANKVLQAYRQVGYTFVPSGSPFGADPTRGLQVLPDGTIYMTEGNNKVTRRTFAGVDGSGNPTWNAATTLATVPAEWNGGGGTDGNLKRFYLDTATGAAYVTGFSTSYPAASREFAKLAGNGMARYNNFLTAGFSQRAWMVQLPSSDTGGDLRFLKFQVSVAIAGAYIFVVEGAQMEVRVYRKSDGGLQDEWIPGSNPKVAFTSTAQLQGQFSTNVYRNGYADTLQPGIGFLDVVQGVHVWQAANGVYVITLYDNGAEKVMVMQWTP